MPTVFPNPQTQRVVSDLAQKAYAIYRRDVDIYRNKIDPFSAVMDAMAQGISIEEWMRQERARQLQKTLQNCIGRFHQSVVASFEGWNDLGVGQIIDVENSSKEIIAEIKNKYNTTKGNHKVQIYRDIENSLRCSSRIGFTGYYVEVIPSGQGIRSIYNSPFTPSDNNTGMRVPLREDIRKIDGKSFYKLVTGEETALQQLYQSLPSMIRIALTDCSIQTQDEDLFSELFSRAFS